MSKTLNGINIDQLVATVNAIKDNPSIARFQFRSRVDWGSIKIRHCKRCDAKQTKNTVR